MKPGATAAVELLDGTGKAVVTDNPSNAASWFKNSTGNVLAKLLLTCCPIRDRGGTWEVFKKRGTHTYAHCRHNTQCRIHMLTEARWRAPLLMYTNTFEHKHCQDVCITILRCIACVLILAGYKLYNTLKLLDAEWSYINKLRGRQT